MAAGSGFRGRAGLAVLAIAPPLVLGSYRWAWAVQHRLLSGAIVAGYETAMVAAGFTGQVWGELRAKWAERLSQHIDQAAGRHFSRFGRNYLDYIRQTHRFIDQKGLATLGERTPELDDVFVDVSLAARSPHQVSGAVLSEPPPDITERRSIWNFLGETASSPVVLAIVGAPGSGKTTLLRHTAGRLCSASRHRSLPVLLMLRESAALITRQPDIELSSVVSAQINGVLDPAPPGWFQQRLVSGRCVVMFDGLDEVALQEHRQCVVDWVDRQIARYPDNDYMITSRPHGYQEYPLERATVLQVRRFTPTQISRFVQGWYLAAERYSTGNSDEFVERTALEEAGNLLIRLNSTPALADLASNPLLLTMIANVHRYRGALPGTRAELYAEMCVVLLGRRQQAKKLADQLRIDQREVVLRELAFTMMRDRVRDLPSNRMSDIIKAVLPRVSVSLGPREFLADIRANGLLLERERGVYCFAHHTFQEYLAATHIRERGQLDTLTTSVGDPWWRETTLLFVARGDAGPVVEACLTSGKIPALTLAFECADVASELTPQLRERLDTLLAEAADPYASAERRSLAAAVIASRQLRNTIRMENGAQACAAPVSNNLYRLFLDHTNAGGSEPVPVGARDDTSDSHAFIGHIIDPLAFVNWLNHLVEADIIYRLPTSAETKDPAINSNPSFRKCCFWFTSENDSGQLSLWVAPETRNPYTITDCELRERAHADAVGPIGVVATYYLALSLVHILAFAHTLALARDPAPGSPNELALALDSALAFAHELAYNLALDLDQGLDSKIADIRELDRRRAHTLGPDPLGPDRGIGHDLASVIVLALARHRALDRALDLDLVPCPHWDPKRARVRDSSLDRARNRAPVLSRALDKVRNCTIRLDPGLGPTLYPGRDLDLVLDRDLALEGEVYLLAGLALDRDLDEVRKLILDLARDQGIDLDVDADLSLWMLLSRASSLFGTPQAIPGLKWLMSQASSSSAGDERTVLPHFLKAQSAAGLKELKHMRATAGNEFLGKRLVNSAALLNDLIRAVAERDRELSSQLASLVRLMALTIAQGIDQLEERSALAQRFVDVAAGITALEKENDASRTNEIITLVCT